MNTDRGWGGRSTGFDLDDIETRLTRVLVPVAPPPEFVRDLKRRLVTAPDVSLTAPAKALYGPIFLVAASVLSGSLLAIMTIKGMRKKRVGSVQGQMKKNKLPEPAGG